MPRLGLKVVAFTCLGHRDAERNHRYTVTIFHRRSSENSMLHRCPYHNSSSQATQIATTDQNCGHGIKIPSHFTVMQQSASTLNSWGEKTEQGSSPLARRRRRRGRRVSKFCRFYFLSAIPIGAAPKRRSTRNPCCTTIRITIRDPKETHMTNTNQKCAHGIKIPDEMMTFPHPPLPPPPFPAGNNHL